MARAELVADRDHHIIKFLWLLGIKYEIEYISEDTTVISFDEKDLEQRLEMFMYATPKSFRETLVGWLEND